MSRAGRWGTLVVLANEAVNIAHGQAHQQLHIALSARAEVFVIGVILVCPVLAMGIMWVSRRRWGPLLLTLSMLGSLVFGVYKHFVAMGPDHANVVAPGTWGTVFVITAYLLVLVEALGAFVGIYLLRGDNRL